MDILNPGDTIILPPGYIHAVISISASSLFGLYIFSQDWVCKLKKGLDRELEFCEQLKDIEKFDLILGRREKDYMMLHELSEIVDGQVKEVADSSLEEE